MRPADVTTVRDADAAIQRLAKWRSHFAGWLLGTRAKTDPQSRWARDNAEKLLLLRVEVSALTRVLIDRGIIDQRAFTIQVGQEAVALERKLQERFPGVSATDDGLAYDLVKIQRAGWMQGWLP